MLSIRGFKILCVLGAVLALLISSSDATPGSAVKGVDGVDPCFRCFAPPMCPDCKPGTTCVIIPASCYSCGSGFCKEDPKKCTPCTSCLIAPRCPRCAEDEECVIVPKQCHDCGYGFCMKRAPRPPPPLLPIECDKPCDPSSDPSCPP
ncbi:hypothetical protein KVV02_006709 [Mortierella alpina]|uniref:Membrane anchor Opy2 N-terminal domain-containing protein n=1 Tax=Mortierella alpina TaxID=64518 RepID=A0A9P8A4H1_MORAP|nr:hypothetical protein KVV02_006709 [Mortierella alpina]